MKMTRLIFGLADEDPVKLHERKGKELQIVFVLTRMFMTSTKVKFVTKFMLRRFGDIRHACIIHDSRNSDTERHNFLREPRCIHATKPA